MGVNFFHQKGVTATLMGETFNRETFVNFANSQEIRKSKSQNLFNSGICENKSCKNLKTSVHDCWKLQKMQKINIIWQKLSRDFSKHFLPPIYGSKNSILNWVLKLNLLILTFHKFIFHLISLQMTKFCCKWFIRCSM